jgi:hypothetical protein
MTTNKRREEIRRCLTPEAVEAWKRIRAGEARYFRCIREPDANCDSTKKARHCAPCAAYLEACRDLDAALGLKPWEDVEDDLDVVDVLNEALEEGRS